MTSTEQPGTGLTDEIKSLIGYETEWSDLSEPVDGDRLRRFLQATMDNDRTYWDEAYARTTKFGGLVCPPLFPTSGLNRRPLGTPDPLDPLKDRPDWDALGAGGNEPPSSRRTALPNIDYAAVGRGRMLNAGTSAEFYQLLRPGDRIKMKRRYADIVERQGRDAPMIITTQETIYHNQNDELLAITRNSSIHR